MEKNSTSSPFFIKLKEYIEDGSIPPKYAEHIKHFYLGYHNAVTSFGDKDENLFVTFLDLVKKQCVEPYLFQPYHQHVRAPFDYYKFGIDFLKPLVDKAQSSVLGIDHLTNIADSLDKGENAIFLANHQTEADPLAICILLEESFPGFAQEMIFVAGERVITDPLAVPFSMGTSWHNAPGTRPTFIRWR
ncbi:MAG: 1-acyl-sn-glycerol-3-phosphate acyltransferase [Candidatus Melainabacteria bacterium]|nr:1-acyl-sn-glycerol-3-phosphate acyltransferase [Candidatus Melainabacteria bacterium]